MLVALIFLVPSVTVPMFVPFFLSLLNPANCDGTDIFVLFNIDKRRPSGDKNLFHTHDLIVLKSDHLAIVRALLAKTPEL